MTSIDPVNSINKTMKILEYLDSNGSASASRLSTELGIKKHTAYTALHRLEKNFWVRRKGAYYSIHENWDIKDYHATCGIPGRKYGGIKKVGKTVEKYISYLERRGYKVVRPLKVFGGDSGATQQNVEWDIDDLPIPEGGVTQKAKYPNPEKKFDRGDKYMKDFQKRVVQELADLEVRISGLSSFVGSEAYSALYQAERTRLTEQLEAMNRYADILKRRIEGF